MAGKDPVRPTTLDHLLDVAWIVVAIFLPVAEFYAVVSMLAAYLLWGIWAVRFLAALLSRTLSPHWAWFVWPVIFFGTVALHLAAEFPYFFLL